MKKMGMGIIGGVVVLIIIAALLIEPVLQLVGKQVFIDNLEIFWILLIAVLFLCVSYIPHYSLFVKRNDKAIIISSAVAVIVSLIANSVLVPVYGLKGAAIASLSAMLTVLLAKSSFVLMRTKA